MRRLGFLDTPFWKAYGSSVVMAVCAMAVFGIGFLFKLHWDGEIAALESAAVVQGNEDAIGSQIQENAVLSQSNAMWSGLTGIDLERKASDDKLAADVLAAATTWSSSDEYATARSKLLSRYSWLDEGSDFLSRFFPPVDSIVVRDASGAVISNPLDDGRNVTFVALYSNVVAVDGDVYSYAGELMTRSDGVGGGGATSRSFVTYEIDGSGVMSNIMVYVVAS